eukprot:gene20075-26069_t
MLHKQINWRINQILSNIIKENKEEINKELNILLEMNSDENRIYLMSTFLDELDFKDVNNRDNPKLAIFQEEILRAMKRPNFISVILQVVEGGKRSAVVQFPEDYTPALCITLRLTAIQSLALAVALSQSQNSSLANGALKLVKDILPAVSGNFLADMSEEVLQSIVHLIIQNKELSLPEMSGKFFNSLRTQPLPPSFNQLLNYLRKDLPQPILQSENTILRQLSDFDSGSRVINRGNISNILVEIGSKCSYSKDIFRQTLRETGIPITEEQVAGIIVTLVNRLISITISNDISDEYKENNKWNLEVVAEVLNIECKGLNWTAVTRNLDQPNLAIRSEAIFLLIARMFLRISAVSMPAAGLVGSWTNKHAQLAMLILASNAPRNLVDFTGIVSAEQQLPVEIAMPPNYSWLSLPLYNTLLQLAAAGLQNEVLEALNNAANNYPEYVTLGLAQVQDTGGVRAEVLRRTLPLFTGIQNSRPSSLVVMKKLLTVNPDLLVLLYRIALKRANTVQDIIDIDNRIKLFGSLIIRRVEEEAAIDENLGYWCIRADRTDFNLEARLLPIIESNSQVVRVIFLFCKAYSDTLRARSADGGLLSYENFTLLLRIVQNYSNIVPTEEVISVASVLNQRVNQAIPQPMLDIPEPDIHRTAGNTVVSEDIEEEANTYFQRIYTSDISIPEVINLLKRFKSSNDKREQEIFRSMIHNLFDEYRFFHKYPDKELFVTGNLFGSLIQHQLVSSITLGIALRYVLEALRKDPDVGGIGSSNEKMYRFGKIALEQFRSRLNEWPQYCSHLLQIPHLPRNNPELYQIIQNALNNTTNPTNNNITSSNIGDMGSNMTNNNVNNINTPNIHNNGGNINSYAEFNLPQPMKALSINDNNAGVNAAPNDNNNNFPVIVVNTSNDQSANTATDVPTYSGIPTTNIADIKPYKPKLTVIERMTIVNVELPNSVMPPDTIRDKIHMIFNNIDKNNVDSKCNELKTLILSDYYNWFANYLVVKRISTHANLHPIYLTLMDNLDNNDLNKLVLDCIYHNTTKLLLSSKITTSSSERSLLRNLGIWLGLTTLARNKPLLHRRIVLKELLIWGYETGRLIAVCSFVARIVEGVRESRVFALPNPWLLAILSLLKEFHELEDLKMNIKFEVQVLCKNINVKLDDIPVTNMLATCKPPIKDQNNPDFNVKPATAAPSTGVTSNTNTPLVAPQNSNIVLSPQVNTFSSPVIGASNNTSSSNNLTNSSIQSLNNNIPSNVNHPISQPINQSYSQPVSQVISPPINQNINQAISQPIGPPISQPITQSINQPSRIINDDSQSSTANEQSLSSNLSISNTTTIPSTNSSISAQEQTVIPNLAAFVNINPSLQFFTSNPAQRRLVSLAVDRAIRELIQPVAERSVTIASVTTKHLIVKDFTTEGNEQLLRKNAHNMISCLAGNLALVTCKEPLRLSICNHLRSLLLQVTNDQSLIEQIVQICSIDNLDLGCKLIEKAATEKAIRDVDESLAASYQLRRKNRETNQPFIDSTIIKGLKYPKDLPDILKPRVGGLLPYQLVVYEGFHRQRIVPSNTTATTPSTITASPASTVTTNPSPAISALPPTAGSNIPMITMSQALEGYQQILSRIELSLRNIQQQAQGREISLSMLGGDNDIITLLREIITITSRIQPNIRNETAMTFAENICKRLLESIGVIDNLRAEVMVGILEALRDVSCTGISSNMKVLSNEITTWLNNYSTFNISDEYTRKMLRQVLIYLLHAKVIKSQDIDTYFSTFMDNGRNMVWVELALGFVKQCLTESLAATYEFANIFDTVSKIRPPNANVRKQLQKILTDLRSLATSKEEGKVTSGAVPSSQTSSLISPPTNPLANQTSNVLNLTSNTIDSTIREHVTVLLEKWLRIWNSVNDHLFSQYLQLMHQYGVLKTEEAADRFFRISTELCIEACLKTSNNTTNISANTNDNELLQELITRVLLERLIVHRPHPWGLLITFMELIKNPRYGFWRKNFTHCAPEIERVFESVARSYLDSNIANSVTSNAVVSNSVSVNK